MIADASGCTNYDDATDNDDDDDDDDFLLSYSLKTRTLELIICTECTQYKTFIAAHNRTSLTLVTRTYLCKMENYSDTVLVKNC